VCKFDLNKTSADGTKTYDWIAGTVVGGLKHKCEKFEKAAVLLKQIYSNITKKINAGFHNVDIDVS
jgi:hypothetical protein